MFLIFLNLQPKTKEYNMCASNVSAIHTPLLRIKVLPLFSSKQKILKYISIEKKGKKQHNKKRKTNKTNIY